MNIKVCGVTQIEQLSQLDKMDVDYAGIIFDDKTPNVAGKTISAAALKALGIHMQIVGRFRHADVQRILDCVDEYRLNIIQLDAAIDAEDCRFLAEHTEVIKTIFLSQHQDFRTLDQQLSTYDDACDYYSFDALPKHHFPWNVLENIHIEKPFFIGGRWLQPSDASSLHRFHHPDFYGVDLHEPFECSPGIKDTALIISFMRAVHQVDN